MLELRSLKHGTIIIKDVVEIKLSILDQSPVSIGETEQQALQRSVRLAQQGEKLGYARFWIAEHHDLFGLACPNPSVMLGVIGSQTRTIRIGAGAVLLPYYKPFHVAETYNLLATLFPGRLDLGLGRAPGGSAEVSLALADNYLEAVKQFPEHVETLQTFLRGQFPDDDTNAKISPTPVPEQSPDMFLLGTSERSAKLAAEKNMGYAFGHFMTDKEGPTIVRTYRSEIAAQYSDNESYVIVAVHVICADTREEAHTLALSYFVWGIRQDKLEADVRIPSVEEAKQYNFSAEDKEKITEMKQKMIIGNPPDVRAALEKLHEQYEADEYMVVTIVHGEAGKLKSYELLQDIVR